MIKENLVKEIEIAQWESERALSIGRPDRKVEFRSEVVTESQTDQEGASNTERLHLSVGDV